jgi:hypothetical protein
VFHARIKDLEKHFKMGFQIYLLYIQNLILDMMTYDGKMQSRVAVSLTIRSTLAQGLSIHR